MMMLEPVTGNPQPAVSRDQADASTPSRHAIDAARQGDGEKINQQNRLLQTIFRPGVLKMAVVVGGSGENGGSSSTNRGGDGDGWRPR